MISYSTSQLWVLFQVQYVIQGYHKRREYIAAFLSHFGT